MNDSDSMDKPDLVCGVCRSTEGDDELGVEQLTRLLGHPLERNRVPDLPDLAEEQKVRLSDPQVPLPKRLDQQVDAAAKFGSIDGIGRTGYTQLRKPELAVDKGVGDHDMQDVHQDYSFHGSPGVAVTVHDGGENVEPGGEGEI